MLKKILLSLIFLLFTITILSQDIVYDSIRGNKNYFLRVKGGYDEQKVLSLVYENLGVISKSKVLSAAGYLDGMVLGKDYVNITFDYDTLVYEFNSRDSINLLIYRFYYPDGSYRYFAGLRHAEMYDDMFEGKYLFIVPLTVDKSEVLFYEGIGSNRKHILTIKPQELHEGSLEEYSLSKSVSVKGIYVSRVVRSSKTDFYYPLDEPEHDVQLISVWPNPVGTILHLEFDRKEELIIRVFNMKPQLLVVNEINNDYHEIDFETYAAGIYIIVIANKYGIILNTVKIVKI